MTEKIDIQIIPIGSSRGIRIPKRVLDRLGMKDHAIAIIDDNSITLKAAPTTRGGWESDARRCCELKEDDLQIPDDLDSDLWRDL